MFPFPTNRRRLRNSVYPLSTSNANPARRVRKSILRIRPVVLQRFAGSCFQAAWAVRVTTSPKPVPPQAAAGTPAGTLPGARRNFGTAHPGSFDASKERLTMRQVMLLSPRTWMDCSLGLNCRRLQRRRRADSGQLCSLGLDAIRNELAGSSRWPDRRRAGRTWQLAQAQARPRPVRRGTKPCYFCERLSGALRADRGPLSTGEQATKPAGERACQILDANGRMSPT